MAAVGIRKAATLLMDLPPATAAELLKSASPDTITRIVAELAYLQKTGTRGDAQHVREFCTLVSKGKPKQDSNSLVRQLLENTLGGDKAGEMMLQVQEVLKARDPFESIRAVPVAMLAKAIQGEAPQIVTMVLTELPAAKSSQLLALLSEDVRISAVQCMAGGLEATAAVKVKVATIIASRLKQEETQEDGPATTTTTTATGQVVDDRRARQLRKLAVLLRALEKTLRDTLIKAITSQDEQTAKDVNKSMVMWEDIPLVADRTLQEILRTVDARKLSLALYKTEAGLTKKFKSNMSERASAMVDEETSLMSSPKSADIEQARETILDSLRAVNDKGELNFQEAATA